MWLTIMNSLKKMICFAMLALTPALSCADLVTFEASDFGLNTTFNEVTTFAFSIDIAGPVAAQCGWNRYYSKLQ